MDKIYSSIAIPIKILVIVTSQKYKFRHTKETRSLATNLESQILESVKIEKHKDSTSSFKFIKLGNTLFN